MLHVASVVTVVNARLETSVTYSSPIRECICLGYNFDASVLSPCISSDARPSRVSGEYQQEARLISATDLREKAGPTISQSAPDWDEWLVPLLALSPGRLQAPRTVRMSRHAALQHP